MTGEEISPEAPEAEVAAPAAPLLRIITPSTTPEEVAAIVAVFSALGGGAPAEEPLKSEWGSPARKLRSTPGRAPAHGRNGWRASVLPR